MGGKTTKLFRSSNQSAKSQDESDSDSSEQLNTYTDQQEESPVKNPISPFVHYRKRWEKNNTIYVLDFKGVDGLIDKNSFCC